MTSKFPAKTKVGKTNTNQIFFFLVLKLYDLLLILISLYFYSLTS